MYEYLRGEVIELTPASAVLEVNNVAYYVNISLQSYTELNNEKIAKLYIHEIIREDAHQLYGFCTKIEREIFRLLISVSGVGANTARLILSSLSPHEIQDAIVKSNVSLLQKIKGIGAKSAQRLIVDLRDKFSNVNIGEEIFSPQSNTIKEESLSALVTLGFSKNVVEKVLEKILSQEKSTDLSVEELIKLALKQL